MKLQQGYILGQADSFEIKDQGDLITEEALSTSAIEGESPDRDSGAVLLTSCRPLPFSARLQPEYGQSL